MRRTKTCLLLFLPLLVLLYFHLQTRHLDKLKFFRRQVFGADSWN